MKVLQDYKGMLTLYKLDSNRYMVSGFGLIRVYSAYNEAEKLYLTEKEKLVSVRH